MLAILICCIFFGSAIWIGLSISTFFITVAWTACAILIIIALLTGSRDLEGKIGAILAGIVAFYTFIIGITGTFFGQVDPSVTMQIMVASGDAQTSSIILILTSVSEVAYAYSVVPPLILFLVLCLVCGLFSKECEFLSFFIALIAAIVFVGSAFASGNLLYLGMSFAISIFAYLFFGYLYGLVWHKAYVQKKYQPYFDCLSGFLKQNDIALPEGVTINDFDVLNPKHLNPDLRPVWKDVLAADRVASSAAEAIKNQTVAHDRGMVIDRMIGWPVVAFGDLFEKMYDFIFSSIGEALTNPFRRRTSKQTKSIRSLDEL